MNFFAEFALSFYLAVNSLWGGNVSLIQPDATSFKDQQPVTSGLESPIESRTEYVQLESSEEVKTSPAEAEPIEISIQDIDSPQYPDSPEYLLMEDVPEYVTKANVDAAGFSIQSVENAQGSTCSRFNITSPQTFLPKLSLCVPVWFGKPEASSNSYHITLAFKTILEDENVIEIKIGAPKNISSGRSLEEEFFAVMYGDLLDYHTPSEILEADIELVPVPSSYAKVLRIEYQQLEQEYIWGYLIQKDTDSFITLGVLADASDPLLSNNTFDAIAGTLSLE
jgi:hypothetical protein